MARLCGATLGLFAFSITIFLSLSSNYSIEETVCRAVTAMALFCGIGMTAGWIAGRVLDEYAVAKSRELLGDGADAAWPAPGTAVAADDASG